MGKLLIGVVGVEPLPHRFNNRHTILEITHRAVEEAKQLAQGGVDSVIVQNLHDLPPTPDSAAEVAAYMTAVGCEIRRQLPGLEMGINVLVDDYRAALAAAAATNSAYVRLKSYVGAAVATSGYSEGCCAKAIEYRKKIGANHVKIYADINERMSRNLAKEDMAFLAGQAVGFGKADAVIITGDTLEQAVQFGMQARGAVGGKLMLLGGGATLDTMSRWAPCFDGAIVGLALRENGYGSPYSPQKIQAFKKKLAEF